MYKYDFTFKKKIVEIHKRTGKGCCVLSREYGIATSTLKFWFRLYELYGDEGLSDKRKHEQWDKETKLGIIQEYLSGGIDKKELCKKYGIYDSSLFNKWLRVYNGHKEFRTHKSSEGDIYMTKGRKTTQDERVEIVAFCIANGKNYALAVETHGVSYQQIYSWVKKYEASGIEGLADRRGKTKPSEQMSEAEYLRQENKILQAKIKDQEMEIALLKKLRELRGGDA